jgi:hypothetical protein
MKERAGSPKEMLLKPAVKCTSGIANKVGIPLGNGPGDTLARAVDLFTDYFQRPSFLSLAVLEDSWKADLVQIVSIAPPLAYLSRDSLRTYAA